MRCPNPSCLTAVLLIAAAAGAAPPVEATGTHATTHVLVRVRPGVSATVDAARRTTLVDAGGTAPAGLADCLDRFGATGIAPALRVPLADPALAAAYGLDRYCVISTPEGTDTLAFAAALGRFDAVIELAELDGIGGVAELPDDPFFGIQYALENTGQSEGAVDADIDAPDAWDITIGATSTVVAILDSGLHDHVDLTGRAIPGYNVFTMDESTDDACQSHGTHVAGILGANGDNGIGIAGVDWSTRIMPVVVVNPCGSQESDVANGVMWAVDNGANIISMSLQYYGGTSFFENAINAANDAGVLLIAATGNNQGPNVAYPAKWPATIAVAATTNQDLHASFSNFGPEVTVAAPGDDIWSTVDTSNYDFKDGTSMATPHVSGLAALVWSIDCSLTNDDVRAIIEASVDDVEAPGFDELTGLGRINAATAVSATGPGEPADLDCNGVVDGADLGILLGDWGFCAGCPTDLDGNGTVDGADLGLLLAAYGG